MVCTFIYDMDEFQAERNALVKIVQRRSDDVAAAAVAAFYGDINIVAASGHTALTAAVSASCVRPKTLRALAAKPKLNPDVPNAWGQVALTYCCCKPDRLAVGACVRGCGNQIVF